MEPIRYAMIKENLVVNITLWDGNTFTWRPPEGILCIPAPDHIGINWRFENDEWLEPIPETP